MVFCPYCETCELYDGDGCYARSYPNNDEAYKNCFVSIVNKEINEDKRQRGDEGLNRVLDGDV